MIDLDNKVNKNEILKVLKELGIKYEIFFNKDQMEKYWIFGNYKLYSQLAIKTGNNVVFFGLFPRAVKVKADNKNKNIIIQNKEGINQQKFKYYQSWFPKIREHYEPKKLTYILFSSTSDFKNNKVSGWKVVSPQTLKSCLEKNILL